jgi:hypothetical protein
MFDLAAIDAMYDAMLGDARDIRWCIFDRRMLLPLSMLPDAVKGETGEGIDLESLRAKAEDGWFSLLTSDSLDGGLGVPLYVPSRIGLLLQLERGGYRVEELRAIGKMEDWFIDNMLTVDELAYVDDDLEAVTIYTREHLSAREHRGDGSTGVDPEYQEEVSRLRKEVAMLERFKAHGIPERARAGIAKAAFRTRAFNDLLRTMLLDIDRGKIKAGYSPHVSFRAYHWSMDGGFSGEDILWRETIKGAMASEEGGEALPIRVPGFLLVGDTVTSTRTFRPSDYSAAWKSGGLDGYLNAWGELRGERRCLNCLATLTNGHERKRFCGEKCRSAARQRRYRERNPEAVERAQKRYWQSVELDEEQE